MQEIEVIKNLTDADKLLRDENKVLKGELEEKTDTLNKLQIEIQAKTSKINELNVLVEKKEAQLENTSKKEKNLIENLDAFSRQISELTKQIDMSESSIKHLKSEINMKNKIEMSLSEDTHKLNDKLTQLNLVLKEKTNQIDVLGQENKTLLDKFNSESMRCKAVENDLTQCKAKLSQLNKDLEVKSLELVSIENLIKSKENEFDNKSTKLFASEVSVKEKLEECIRNKQALQELKEKYELLGKDSETKVGSLTREIDRLNKEKDELISSFEELQLEHTKCASIKSVENENEKALLKKLELQAINSKYESKSQYLEIEIDTLRSKVRKLLKVNRIFLLNFILNKKIRLYWLI
jgi:chromosome segregation ATPase